LQVSTTAGTPQACTPMPPLVRVAALLYMRDLSTWEKTKRFLTNQIISFV